MTSKPISSTPITSHPTALVHPTCTITGNEPISIGPNSIIHLRTSINSTYTPLTISEYTLISERVTLGYTSPPAPSAPPTTYIGSHTVIESGAIVEAASIGSCCVVETGAKIGKGAILGNGVKVCALAVVAEGEVLDDGTVVFGSGQDLRRKDGSMLEQDEKEAMGLKMRRELVEALEQAYRRVWTGK